MRTLLISLATATAAMTVAAPASAQYYPAPPPRHVPQGNAYGYHHNYGQVRALQVRIDRLQRRIHQLDNRDFLSEREARRLRQESRELEQRLRRVARYGLSPREHYSVSRRIQRLEYRIYRDANDRNRWARYGYNDQQWNPERWDDRWDRAEDRRDRREDRWDRREDRWDRRN